MNVCDYNCIKDYNKGQTRTLRMPGSVYISPLISGTRIIGLSLTNLIRINRQNDYSPTSRVYPGDYSISEFLTRDNTNYDVS